LTAEQLEEAMESIVLTKETGVTANEITTQAKPSVKGILNRSRVPVTSTGGSTSPTAPQTPLHDLLQKTPSPTAKPRNFFKALHPNTPLASPQRLRTG
jgi:hypothetical protein